MEDSGSRDTFSTGCVRDNGENKPRPDLISPFAKFRLGEWLRLGAEKYDERNWEKGMSISRCLEAIDRHYCQYQMGMRNEDHIAAVMCNAMFIMHYEEMIKIGHLPNTLDDRPSYEPMPIRVYNSLPAFAPSTTKDDNAMAVMQEATDKAYGLELDGQNDNPLGLAMPPVSKVTGKATADRVVKQFNKVFLPDDNKLTKPKPYCEICGNHNLRYYRYDLDRYYCTLCYHNNRIDLKPVIRS